MLRGSPDPFNVSLLHYCIGSVIALRQAEDGRVSSERVIACAESHSLELKAPFSSRWGKALIVLPHLQASSGERIAMAIICILSMACPAQNPPVVSYHLTAWHALASCFLSDHLTPLFLTPHSFCSSHMGLVLP